MRGKARDHSEEPGGSGDRIPRVSPTDPRSRQDVLALETATPWCSVAVSHGGQVFSRHVPADQRHGEMALALVDEVLREAGTRLDSLRGIAFGEGPGSFTGLRIACGIVQGLALGQGLPVLGISTLLAVAQASGEKRVIACLDARMGEVYHAAYVRDEAGSDWREVLAPGVCAPGDVPLPEGSDWVGCGSGFAAHGAVLAARYGERLVAVKPDVAPAATAVLQLAQPRFARGEGADAAQAAPIYLRDKVALTTRERADLRARAPG